MRSCRKLLFPALILWVSLLVWVSFLGRSVPAAAAAPLYVGEAACRQCHHDQRRDQFSPWRLSKHARAYAALALPSAREIARLCGIDRDPFGSPICLTCHATASRTEAFERDPFFSFEDGIQCESCHGPGSDYADAKIMANEEAAKEAGLQRPDLGACMTCHQKKSSHLAVLEGREFDYQESLREIGHPGRAGEPVAQGPNPRGPLESGLSYVGVRACAACHESEEMGHIISQWRLSAHADAYAILGTEKAREIAAAEGVAENPQGSDRCLRCHTTGFGEPSGRLLDSFDVAEGVQCESCHGPCSEHSQTSPDHSPRPPLGKSTREPCTGCHSEGIHGRPFDYDEMSKRIDHAKRKTTDARGLEYKTPTTLALTRGGERLFVACESSDSLMVLDALSGKVLAEVKVQHQPHGVCLSPDERWAYVSNRGSDSVSVVDARTFRVTATIPVGGEPHGLAINARGSALYVLNAGSDDVSVVNLADNREEKRLAAARGTWGVARSQDGKQLFVTNDLPQLSEFREPPSSEVTVIETEGSFVRSRMLLPGTNRVRGVACSPDGKFALVTLIRSKNLVPMTRVVQGWVMTHGLGVLWKDGRVDQLLLDEVDSSFADPNDVVITPNGRTAYVSSGGTNEVAVVDIPRLMALLARASRDERESVLPNHLGVSTEYVLKRIPVGENPRGLAVSRDGRAVYVADALGDTISVLDTASQTRARVLRLTGPRPLSPERLGERIFHSADFAFGRQFSCGSCHPDGGADGLTYDLEPDGLGMNPVDNRTLRGILDTNPFKWEGTNLTLGRQCGPRLAVFFTRIDPIAPEQMQALVRYVSTIPRPLNRYRPGEGLTPAERRGKQVFERARTNTGEEIPERDRCGFCHPPPYFTNRRVMTVGTESQWDTHRGFDVPHLNNIYETPPYLHDGRAPTLEEIWTRFNPRDQHGVTNDLTKDQLNDLVLYLKTL